MKFTREELQLIRKLADYHAEVLDPSDKAAKIAEAIVKKIDAAGEGE